MKLNKRARHDLMLELEYFMNMLVKHFEYSIKDIKSYEELTDAEKTIIPKWLFDKITEND